MKRGQRGKKNGTPGRGFFRAGTILILVSLALALCLPAQAGEGRKKHTVMVYLCGSDLELTSFMGSMTLGEIAASGFSPEEVNVLVLLGGSGYWATGYSGKSLTLLQMTPTPLVLEGDLPLESMGEEETLRGFLDLAYTDYPADHYELILWDHGAGPIYGVCHDQIFGDALDLEELTGAIGESLLAEEGFDLIAFHACLMGSAEVAMALSPYARLMVATEDSMRGLDYGWLADLHKASGLREVGERMVDGTFDLNEEIIRKVSGREVLSVSLVDLGAMEELSLALDSFFEKVQASLDDLSFTLMSDQRRDTLSFGLGESGGSGGFDLADLGSLIENLGQGHPERAEPVRKALSKAVLYHRGRGEESSGLTVYHPFLNKEKMEERMGIYNTLPFSEGYRAYLQLFSSILTGTALGQWEDLSTQKAEGTKGVRTRFTLTLSEEQAHLLGEAHLQVLERVEEGYRFVSISKEASLQGQTLSGEYGGEALYVVDEEEKEVFGPVRFALTSEGDYEVPMTLVKEWEGQDLAFPALVTFAWSPSSRSLVPGRIRLYQEGMGGYLYAEADLSDYERLVLSSQVKRQTRDEGRTLHSFDQWEVVKAWEQSFDLGEGISFALLSEKLDLSKLVAGFTVRDSQNNGYVSELLSFQEESEGEALRMVYDDKELLRIENLEVFPLGGDVSLLVDVRGLSEKQLWLSLENLTLQAEGGSGEGVVLPTAPVLLEGTGSASLSLVGMGMLEGLTSLSGLSFDIQIEDADTGEVLESVPVEVSFPGEGLRLS